MIFSEFSVCELNFGACFKASYERKEISWLLRREQMRYMLNGSFIRNIYLKIT